MTHDGIGKYLSQVITKAPGETADVVKILQDTKTDVVVSYLPVGSEEATKWYVEQVLAAGCGFVNCIPVFIAREPYWRRRFEEKGLPIVGDDIKSQVGRHDRPPQAGAPVPGAGRAAGTHPPAERRRQHRLPEHARARAARVKKISKTNAVTSQLDSRPRRQERPHRPVRHVPWLDGPQVGLHPARGPLLRRRAAQHRAEARGVDSPNSAGIVIDAVRCASWRSTTASAARSSGRPPTS
jgi:myo-inositol-1-phosphate synthase